MISIHKSLLKISVFSSFLVCSTFAGAMDDAIQAFETTPDFVRPTATILGAMNNSGFIATSQVNQDLKFAIGIPLVFVSIPSDDKSYTLNGKEVPTIFGGKPATGLPAGTREGSLGDHSTFGLPYLSGSVSKNGFLGTLRWLPFSVPTSLSEGNTMSLNVFGIGLQADLNPWISKWTEKELPVQLGLAYNYTSTSIEFGPKQYDGTLKLDGITSKYALVVGKKWGNAEVFSDIGFESSTMTPSGSLTKKIDPSVKSNPTQSFDGTNGFRLGLTFAYHGPFAPVLGANFGRYTSYVVDILHWRQQ